MGSSYSITLLPLPRSILLAVLLKCLNPTPIRTSQHKGDILILGADNNILILRSNLKAPKFLQDPHNYKASFKQCKLLLGKVSVTDTIA